jgi:hypothetical protein
MALSKETAGKIIEVVAADANCRKAIQPISELGYLGNPGTALLLEFTHLAGSVRNLAMMAQGKYRGDAVFEERICSGIAVVTVNAIFAAVKQGKLPGVQTAGPTHRVHRTIEHEATAIDMVDGSIYVFDWHATLKIRDPVISKLEDWRKAENAVNYVLFSGFK